MSVVDPFVTLARVLGKGGRLELRLRTSLDVLSSVGAGLASLGGPQAVERGFAAPAHAAGRRTGARYQSEFSITGRNAISAAAPAVVALETYEAKYSVETGRPRLTELRVRACPVLDVAREAGPDAARAMCAGCGSHMKGLVEAVNPGAQVDMPERMGWGNAYCRLEVKVSGKEPGPSALDVPRDIEFMPATTRKRLLSEALDVMLTETARVASESIDAATAARGLSSALPLAGMRTSRRSRGVVERDGLDSALAVIGLLAETRGVRAALAASQERGASWQYDRCLFTDGLPASAEAGRFACGACRHFHEGLLADRAGPMDVQVQSSVLRGDARCSFAAHQVPARSQLRTPERGWLDAHETRVALVDADSTYYYLWKLLGPTLEHVGRRAGADLVRREVLNRGLSKDEAGLRAAMERLVGAGFGGVETAELDLRGPTARMRCANSFEADAVLAHEKPQEDAVCHTLRGMLAGAFEEMTGLRQVEVREVLCRGKGDAACEFVVG